MRVARNNRTMRAGVALGLGHLGPKYSMRDELDKSRIVPAFPFHGDLLWAMTTPRVRCFTLL